VKRRSPETLSEALAEWRKMLVSDGPASLDQADEWIDRLVTKLTRSDRQKFVAQAWKDLGVKMPALD
jgi:hypothetical protein